jgi:hypothetical protein
MAFRGRYYFTARPFRWNDEDHLAVSRRRYQRGHLFRRRSARTVAVGQPHLPVRYVGDDPL